MALAGSDTGRCQQLNGLRVNGGGGAVLSCLVQEGMLLITCGFPAQRTIAARWPSIAPGPVRPSVRWGLLLPAAAQARTAPAGWACPRLGACLRGVIRRWSCLDLPARLRSPLYRQPR
jgi:hypothetical protein